MLCFNKLFFVFFLLWNQYSCANEIEKKLLYIKSIINTLLTNIESSTNWNENVLFGLNAGEFLIKQKSFFHIPTQFELPIYNELLHNMDQLRDKIVKKHGTGELGRILQHNTLFRKPILRVNEIDTSLEYESLIPQYDYLMKTAYLIPDYSDLCLLEISALEKCENLRPECLKEISAETPTYGYPRVHQLLTLFVLMHHTCSLHYESGHSFHALARKHCTQIYREHRVISGAFSKPRRDLYVEQSAMCSLFGFEEFLNITEIEKIRQWEKFGVCDCVGKVHIFPPELVKSLCFCSDHMHSISILLYINALLFAN